ncbi:MAG: hypothetical protein RSG92_12705 [Pseudomonas sp.]
MSKTMGCIGFALAVSMGASSSVMAENKLFKDIAYDSPMSFYSETKGYYDCSEDVGAIAVCKDDVDFIGHKFTMALVFSGDKLTTVSLVSDYEQALYDAAMAALNKSFTLSMMSDGKSQLDLVELARQTRSRDEFLTQFTRYAELGTTAGDFTYTFLEGADTATKYASVTMMLLGSPDNTRSAELVLTGEGADSTLVIRFSFPKLELNKAHAAAQKPVESF